MKLLLTRPVDQCGETKKKLEARGHKVFVLPLIRIAQPKEGGLALRRALKNVDRYQWLIVTSQNAMRAVRMILKKIPKNLKIIRVKKKGVAGLIRFFKNKKVAGQKILYPISQIGRKELVKILKKKGAKVDVVEAYQTLPAFAGTAKLQKVLEKGIEAVLFFSPSAVDVFFKKMSGKKSALKKLHFIPIGPTTARAIRSKGYKTSSTISPD